MSTVIANIIESLKADNTVEAFDAIKAELTVRAKALVESTSLQVAQEFRLKPIDEAFGKDDKEESDKEDDKSEEEKEKEKGEKEVEGDDEEDKDE